MKYTLMVALFLATLVAGSLSTNHTAEAHQYYGGYHDSGGYGFGISMFMNWPFASHWGYPGHYSYHPKVYTHDRRSIHRPDRHGLIFSGPKFHGHSYSPHKQGRHRYADKHHYKQRRNDHKHRSRHGR